MWNNVPWALAKFQEMPRFSSLERSQVFHTAFPDLHIIHVTRPKKQKALFVIFVREAYDGDLTRIIGPLVRRRSLVRSLNDHVAECLPGLHSQEAPTLKAQSCGWAGFNSVVPWLPTPPWRSNSSVVVGDVCHGFFGGAGREHLEVEDGSGLVTQVPDGPVRQVMVEHEQVANLKWHLDCFVFTNKIWSVLGPVGGGHPVVGPAISVAHDARRASKAAAVRRAGGQRHQALIPLLLGVAWVDIPVQRQRVCSAWLPWWSEAARVAIDPQARGCSTGSGAPTTAPDQSRARPVPSYSACQSRCQARGQWPRGPLGTGRLARHF
jgi:hypothetical protein